ncbi:MAG: histidine kinase dimerization/phospho-acceptor domain-containing protein [Bdellovibrionales bacterium]
MRISITLKLCLGVFAILTGALTVLLWKTSSILKEDKISYLKEQTSQISYGLALGASEKMKRLDRQMTFYMSATPSAALARASSNEFYSVGMLSRELGQPWSIDWNYKSQAIDQGVDGLLADFLTTVQKNLQLDTVKSGDQTLIRLLTHDKQPIFALLSRQPKTDEVAEKIAVSLLKTSVFFDLISIYKGGVQSAYIVDGQSVVYAHPSIHLTGTILNDDPIMQDIRQNFAASTVEQYVTSDGDSLIGSYDRVPGTNLFVVTAVPWEAASAALAQLRSSFMILGLGLIFIALALTYWSSQLLRQPLLKIKRAIEDIAVGRPTIIETSSDDEIGDLAESLFIMDQKLRTKELETRINMADQIYQGKMSAFSQFSSGLVNELRNPLIGVLGHVQLAKEKMRDSEGLRRHLDLIENDCRKTKEFIEDISQFTGSDKLGLDNINIYETTVAAIEQAERRLHPQNISVIKNLSSSSSIVANPVLIRKALQNILAAAGQLSPGTEPRDVIVRLESSDTEVDLTCVLSSPILGDVNFQSIFEPFYKIGIEETVNLGLDLALAKGIIEAHDGKISFERVLENQYQFKIQFPKAMEAKAPGVPLGQLVSDPLHFSLPHFSIKEKKEVAISDVLAQQPVVIAVGKSEETSEPAPFLTEKKFLGKVPIEKLKIRIKPPRLRT